MKNRFADLISLGFVSTILGITSLSYAARLPLISILLGVVGALPGIASLRIPTQEKLERWSAWAGIVLCSGSMVWSLVILYGQ